MLFLKLLHCKKSGLGEWTNMGYRSSINSIVYGEPEKLHAFMAVLKLEGNASLQRGNQGWGDEVQLVKLPISNYEGFMLEVDDRKWYEGNKWVDDWEHMLTHVTEAGLNYEHIRIGEDSEDVDVRQDGDDVRQFLMFSRSVENEITEDMCTPLYKDEDDEPN